MKRSLVCAAVLALLGIGGPAAADPAGTRLLDAQLSEVPVVQVLGASASGVLYRIYHPDARGAEDGSLETLATFLRHPDGATERLDGWDSLWGDLVANRVLDPATGDVTVTYRTVTSPTTRTCPAGRGRGPLFTSRGWLWTDPTPPTDREVLTVAGPAGCTTQVLQDSDGAWTVEAADATGFLLLHYANGTNGEERGLRHVTFTVPPVVTDVDLTTVRPGWPGVFALAGDQVAWRVPGAPGSGAAQFVYRATLGGGPPVETPVSQQVRHLELTPTHTSWSTNERTTTPTYGGVVGTIPASGGVSTQDDRVLSLVSDGTAFVLGEGHPTAGLYRTSGLESGRASVGTVPFLRPLTTSVSVTAGRLAYADTSGDPVATVHLRATPGLATLGTLPRAHDVDVDGRRMTYVRDGRLLLRADGAAEQQVFTPTVGVAILGRRPAHLSGSRLLWYRADHSRDDCSSDTCQPVYDDVVAVLTDLRTGASTVLGPDGPDLWALWGSYLAHGLPDGSITRRDLSSGAVVTAKGAGPALTSVDLHSRWVGWSSCATGRCSLGQRDVSRGGPVRTLSVMGATTVRLSGGHLLYATGTQVRTLRVWRLGTTATGLVGPLRGDRGSGAAFDPEGPLAALADVADETLVWTGPDETARTVATSSFVDPPRYLGNALGRFQITRGTQVWAPEFPLSKALPSCSVVVRSTITGTVLRRLPCSTGSSTARVSWDGRLENGALVPAGTYDWTLTGSDADGALRWWNDATQPIRGHVVLSRPA